MQSTARRLTLAAAALACVGGTSPSFADEIRLTNGRTLEGKAERVGGEVVIRSGGGEMRLDAKEVASIKTGPTKEDFYKERLAKIDAKDVAAQVGMADWCKEQGLRDLEKRHLRAVIDLQPDHEAARARLGFVRYDGRWLTLEEYYAARGFVKVGSEWISKDEIARRLAEKQAKASADAHVRKIRDAVAKMSSPRRKVRADGKHALQLYAEEIGDASLGQFASDVGKYYNEQWRAVKAEWEGGTATVEVRATSTTLKRPIPTIETSLGAFSTPVRIQLPELSVVSIRTTARVPITIELDDE